MRTRERARGRRRLIAFTRRLRGKLVWYLDGDFEIFFLIRSISIPTSPRSISRKHKEEIEARKSTVRTCKTALEDLHLTRPSAADRRQDQTSASFKMQSEIIKEGEQHFQIRRLQISDKSKGFIELLQQLSVCDSVSDEEFKARFQELSSYGDDHVICVIEDNKSGKIVATGSVFVEKKFLRNCGKAGHIEDVVVDSSTRGMGLGQKIVDYLTKHARSMGCYKVILDCSIENKGFYEKCGFKQKAVQMFMYF